MNAPDVPSPCAPLHYKRPSLLPPRGMPAWLPIAAVVAIAGIVGAGLIVVTIVWFQATVTVATFSGTGPGTTAAFSIRHAWKVTLTIHNAGDLVIGDSTPLAEIKLYDESERLIHSWKPSLSLHANQAPGAAGPGRYYFAIDCPPNRVWTIEIAQRLY